MSRCVSPVQAKVSTSKFNYPKCVCVCFQKTFRVPKITYGYFTLNYIIRKIFYIIFLPSIFCFLITNFYTLEEEPLFNGRIDKAIYHGYNQYNGNVPYSELKTVLHRNASSAVAVYCFGPVKTEFISSLTIRLLTSLG